MTHDEIASARWFKSSHSRGERECVEVAFLPDGRVALRDTKHHTTGPIHTVPNTEWTAFLAATKTAQFNRH